MENTTNMFSNGTACAGKSFNDYILISNIFSIFIGQPVLVKLLWTAFHSKRKDILNINLAVFHNIQYLLTTMHVCIIYLDRELNFYMISFLTVYLVMGGPLTLAFICLERYIAVIHPTFYPLLNKYRCREGCVLSMWVLVLPTATINAFLDILDIESNVMSFIVYTILSLVAIEMAWVNIAILKVLRTSGPGTDKLHPAKKRASQTVFGIAFISLICYTPVGFLVFFSGFAKPNSICVVVPAIIFLVSVASVAHPIFYLTATGNLPCRRSPPTQKQHC